MAKATEKLTIEEILEYVRSTAAGFFTADWFPYYRERFEASDKVALMSLAEEGAYHRAIRIAWKYRWLPASAEGMSAKVQKRCTPKIAEKVLTTFIADPNRPGKVVHPVVEEIRIEQEQKYLNRRKGGLHSRKNAKNSAPVNNGNGKTSSITLAEPEHCSSSTPTRIENRDKREERSFPNGKDLKRLIERTREKFSNLPAKQVEIAVLETLIRRESSEERSRPIRSPEYFREEIEKFVKQSSGVSEKTLDALLQRRREQAGKISEQGIVNSEQVTA